MLGLLNTVLSKGGSLLTYVKEGLVMANRFLSPPKLSFPANASAEFDGASDYIKTASLPLSDWTNFTYSAWVYFDTASYQNILGFGNLSNATPVSLIELQSNYKINFFHRDDSAANVGVLSNAINLNQWYFLTATKEGSSFKLYIDGSIVNTGSGSTSTPTLNTFNIGRLERSFVSNYVDGNLANVAIWNRALSSDEINSVMWKSYTLLNTSEKEGLQAWYSLEESELLSGDSTPTLEKYAAANSLTFEGKQCLQDALNALPTITDARLYSAKYDIRVSADGGTVESLDCVETELNAIV